MFEGAQLGRIEVDHRWRIGDAQAAPDFHRIGAVAVLGQADRGILLFSGGQDSATCLAWALERHDHVETIGFDYGQRHKVELEVRADFRDAIKEVEMPARRPKRKAGSEP